MERQQARRVREFLETLPSSWPGVDGYTHEQQTADFRRVFVETPEGQRVFSQIARMAHGSAVGERDVGDHSKLAFRCGMTWLYGRMGAIITGMTSRPVEVERQ